MDRPFLGGGIKNDLHTVDKRPFSSWHFRLRSKSSVKAQEAPFTAGSTASSSAGTNSSGTGSSSVTNPTMYDILVHYSGSEESFVHQTVTPGLEDEALEQCDNDSLLSKRTICYVQQNQHSISENNIKQLNDLITKCACVVVVASDTYIQNEFRATKDSSELRVLADKCYSSRKCLIVLSMDSVTSQALKQFQVKPSSVLMWGTPNFWQLVGNQLPKRSSTLKISNSKLLAGLTSPRKPLSDSQLVDDELWTYLKGQTSPTAENKARKTLRPADSVLTSLPPKRPSATLKTASSFHAKPSIEEQFFNSQGEFNHSTLQSGRRRHYLRNNGLQPPGSTPTQRRTSQPSPSSLRQNFGTARTTKNLVENPLDALTFGHDSSQPNTRKSPFNQSDSDYMSVSDSLAPSRSNNPSSNEPIYHTLDEDQPELRRQQPPGNKDDLVYINSALEVVYPTTTMLKKQQRLLEQLRSNQHHNQADDEEENEFDELLGAEETDEDVYENSSDAGFFGQDQQGSYVPSPAPGSFPRNYQYSSGITGPLTNSPNSRLMSQIANRLNTAQTGPKRAKPGNYFVWDLKLIPIQFETNMFFVAESPCQRGHQWVRQWLQTLRPTIRRQLRAVSSSRDLSKKRSVLIRHHWTSYQHSKQ